MAVGHYRTHFYPSIPVQTVVWVPLLQARGYIKMNKLNSACVRWCISKDRSWFSIVMVGFFFVCLFLTLEREGLLVLIYMIHGWEFSSVTEGLPSMPEACGGIPSIPPPNWLHYSLITTSLEKQKLIFYFQEPMSHPLSTRSWGWLTGNRTCFSTPFGNCQKFLVTKCTSNESAARSSILV